MRRDALEGHLLRLKVRLEPARGLRRGVDDERRLRRVEDDDGVLARELVRW